MSRDSRLPTITSDIPRDLRAFTDELRRALTHPSGYKAWAQHRLPHVASRLPSDLLELTRRIREELLRYVPLSCINKFHESEYGHEWLYPRDSLPRLTSSVQPDVRRFFERAREMMVREKPEICPEEKVCDSPEGSWVTSLMYPLEFVEEMESSASVSRGQFYRGIYDSLMPSLLVTSGVIEIVYNDIHTDVGWDSLIPTLQVPFAEIVDLRVYAEAPEEVITSEARIDSVLLKPGIFTTHPTEIITSSASIVSGGLE